MTLDREIPTVLEAYPDECQARRVEAIESDQAFSGARIWRLDCSSGLLCLRRWPAEYPAERLEFVQAVLWQVDQEGVHFVPVPLETRHRSGYVRHGGALWELTPWMPGRADYREAPSRAKLEAALRALAQFHEAASGFPLPNAERTVAPGILARRGRLVELRTGRLEQIIVALGHGDWPELALRGREIIELFRQQSESLAGLLDRAAALQVAVQPCIRDIWQEHVLFQGPEVSGLVDFGAMRADSVATDIARLLGSMATDSQADWEIGLAAYQSVRRLSNAERELITAYDRSGVLLGGLQWLDWVYLQGRTFSNRRSVLERIDQILARLLHRA